MAENEQSWTEAKDQLIKPSAAQLKAVRTALTKAGASSKTVDHIIEDLTGVASPAWAIVIKSSPEFAILHNASHKAREGKESSEHEMIESAFILMAKFKKEGFLTASEKVSLGIIVKSQEVKARILDLANNSDEVEKIVDKALDDLNRVYKQSGAAKFLSEATTVQPGEVYKVSPTQLAKAASAQALDAQRTA